MDNTTLWSPISRWVYTPKGPVNFAGKCLCSLEVLFLGVEYILTHAATHCTTLQHTPSHTATLCNTLQHNTTHCNTQSVNSCVQHHTALHCHTHCNTHCNTLQHTAANCNTQCVLMRAATHCIALQHTLYNTATHCNTLQHTATHCNTQSVYSCAKQPELLASKSPICRPLSRQYSLDFLLLPCNHGMCVTVHKCSRERILF